MGDVVRLSTQHIRAKFRHLPATAIRFEHLLYSAGMRTRGHTSVVLAHSGAEVEFKAEA